jgi:hypothetical protein
MINLNVPNVVTIGIISVVGWVAFQMVMNATGLARG